MQIIGTFGRGLGINPDDVKMEDATKLVKLEDTSIYGGSPLALINDAGVFKLASFKYLMDEALGGNIKPYGLAKFNKNAYIDETFDQQGMYGSGKGTAIQLGRVTLMNNIFRTVAGGVTPKFGFVESITDYAPMQELYINLDVASADCGKLTNVKISAVQADRNDNTLVGYVANYFASATQPVLEVLLK